MNDKIDNPLSKIFGVCALCGKKLISYDSQNNIKYIFGDSVSDGSPVVDMKVSGCIRIKCTRKSCRRENPDHWNTFSCFE